MCDSNQPFPTPSWGGGRAIKFPVKNISDVPGGRATFFDDPPKGRAEGLGRVGPRAGQGDITF